MPLSMEFRDIFDKTRVVRFPKRRLATFGRTDILYRLVTPLSQSPARSTVRLGRITVEKPQIIRPDAAVKRFEGFGPAADLFEKWLRENVDAFRGLQYTFKNSLEGVMPHHTDVDALLAKIQEDLDRRDIDQAAVVAGPEGGWPLSLMKFILEEMDQSFPANVRELEERGLFDPGRTVLNRRRRELEALFQEARMNPGALDLLAKKLREYDLFEEYQDRFFALVKPR